MCYNTVMGVVGSDSNREGVVSEPERRTYTFYNDPGHAWLEVPQQDVRT